MQGHLLQKNAGVDLNRFEVAFHDHEGDDAHKLYVKTQQGEGMAPGAVTFEYKTVGRYLFLNMSRTKNGKLQLRFDARLLSHSDELRTVAQHEIAETAYIQKNIEGKPYPNNREGQQRLAWDLAEAHREGLDAMQ